MTEPRQLTGHEEDITVNRAIETDAFRSYWEELSDDYQPRATDARAYEIADGEYERAVVDFESRYGDSHGSIVVLLDGADVQYSEAVLEEVEDGDLERFEEYRFIDDDVRLHTAQSFDGDQEPGSLVPQDG